MNEKLKEIYESLLEEWYSVEEEKKCPEGQQWCPIKKKCVPIGSGDRQGPRSKGEIVEDENVERYLSTIEEYLKDVLSSLEYYKIKEMSLDDFVKPSIVNLKRAQNLLKRMI